MGAPAQGTPIFLVQWKTLNYFVQELQQKTLDEVRKEAEKLQRLGKNAQHDDLVGKRKKTANSSEKLAKQNSTLLLRGPAPLSPAAASSRIKGIVKEYIASHDLDETRACLRELPRDVHVSFIDTALTYALEGKDHERSAAVDMLASLYETLDLGATEMQSALLNTLEFLDDLRIDIPMVRILLSCITSRMADHSAGARVVGSRAWSSHSGRLLWPLVAAVGRRSLGMARYRSFSSSQNASHGRWTAVLPGFCWWKFSL